MTPSNNSSNAHIFVGCGGSGIQSLTRLNALLSQDKEWRQRMGSDVYYIAIDTDASELNDFDEEIEYQCRKAQKPYVGRVDLGKGLMNIGQPMRKHFVDPYEGANQRKLQGKESLKKHWWHNGDSEPFFAPKQALRTAWERFARPKPPAPGSHPTQQRKSLPQGAWRLSSESAYSMLYFRRISSCIFRASLRSMTTRCPILFSRVTRGVVPRFSFR